MEYDKISVIVPVYNVEKYLERCIKSIIGSTYADLEIILVDDGSTDGSCDICDTFARTDERVRVIHKENGGASSARNAGLDAAAGDFIGFVDSDDEISPAMYETMHHDMIKNKAQIAVCGCKVEYGSRSDGKLGTNDIYAWNSVGAIEHLITEKKIATSVSNKLYSKELFDNIRFDETITHGEDRLINYYLMKNAKRVVFRDAYLYIHRKRKGSATTSRFSEKQFSGIKAAKKIRADIDESIPRLRRCGVNCAAKAMLSSYIRSLPYAEFKAERKQIRAELNEIWKSDKRNIIPRLKAAMILFRLHPALLYTAYKIYKSIKYARIRTR